MLPLLTSQQMAAADRFTINVLGVTGIELMERAAQACVEELVPLLKPADRIAVFTGAGNNGGDGFAIARLLLERGFLVTTFLLVPESRLTGDALTQCRRLRLKQAEMVAADTEVSLDDDFQWCVDAIFGTGLNRPAEGRFARAIEEINRAKSRVLAVDLPSGLSGSTGFTLGEAVRAEITVTFQFLKLAHAVTPACFYCGKVVLKDIGIRMEDVAEPRQFLLETTDFHRPARALDEHKGSFGAVVVIGGFRGMEGAANLAALAALRFGAGKVKILSDHQSGRFHHDSVMTGLLEEFSASYDAYVIGPGLSRTLKARAALADLDVSGARVVWDADALFHLKEDPSMDLGADWVMTPHPGEAAYLLGCPPAQVQNDRVAALWALGEKFPGGWILLKGYRSLMLSPKKELYVCKPGHPALAVGGSGDVLSGMIGALLGAGLTTSDAVRLACLRHGMAGDRWAQNYRDYAMLAEDIIHDLIH